MLILRAMSLIWNTSNCSRIFVLESSFIKIFLIINQGFDPKNLALIIEGMNQSVSSNTSRSAAKTTQVNKTRRKIIEEGSLVP